MGSGLAGGAVGAGIQIDFTRYMNRMLEIAPDGSSARVQPGLVMASLNQEAARYGTFFAPDPSSENYCSLGGMIGTNSSGARTVAYGGTKDHVLALEVVLADGSVLRARATAENEPELAALLPTHTLAGRAFAKVLPELRTNAATIAHAMPRVVKNCSGYRLESIFGDADARGGTDAAGPVPGERLAHLQKLFVGAEGTLGLVTEATLSCPSVDCPYTSRRCSQPAKRSRYPRPQAGRSRDHGLHFLALVRKPGSESAPCCPWGAGAVDEIRRAAATSGC
jgi:FAD/FMN-containing dehydrogenase